MDTGEATGPGETANHLVVLVHGINTRALWMGEVKPALERAGFFVGPTSYGKFGVPRFLRGLPSAPKRKSAWLRRHGPNGLERKEPHTDRPSGHPCLLPQLSKRRTKAARASGLIAAVFSSKHSVPFEPLVA